MTTSKPKKISRGRPRGRTSGATLGQMTVVKNLTLTRDQWGVLDAEALARGISRTELVRQVFLDIFRAHGIAE